LKYLIVKKPAFKLVFLWIFFQKSQEFSPELRQKLENACFEISVEAMNMAILFY